MSKNSPNENNKDHTKIEIQHPPVRTQFLIFTLLGDFIWGKGGKIWTGSLLHLMDLLGVSERAVRSALSRMTRKGWISPKKFGRKSQYSLTGKGIALMERGQQRIFESPFTDWDGTWHLVVYSLPEEKRGVRHALRTQLAWLGYGPLSPGTWISTRTPSNDLERTFSELQVEDFIEMFSGEFLGPSSSRELVNRCWDLDALGDQYSEFLNSFQSDYDKCKQNMNNGSTMDPEDCFVRRFWVTHQFQSFPFRDPNLPVAILPKDWIGTKARKLFIDYHNLLGVHAGTFVDEVLENEGGL